MRWGIIKEGRSNLGRYRIVRSFLFWPKKIGTQTRWLEWAEWMENLNTEWVPFGWMRDKTHRQRNP